MACASQQEILKAENTDPIHAHLIFYQPGLSEGLYLFTAAQRIPSGEVVDLLFNFGLCMPPGGTPLVDDRGQPFEVNPRTDCIFYSNWLPFHTLDENDQTVNVLQTIFMAHMKEEFSLFFKHLENVEQIQPYFDQYVYYLTAYTEYLTIAIGASLVRQGQRGNRHPALRSGSQTIWTKATGWSLLSLGFLDLITPLIKESFQIDENHHRRRWLNLQKASENFRSAIAAMSPSHLLELSDPDGRSEPNFDITPSAKEIESRLQTFFEDAIHRSLRKTWKHSPGVCGPTLEFYRDFTFKKLNKLTNRRFS